MNINKIYYRFKTDSLGLSGYKMNFFRRKILYGMYKRKGIKGILHFIKNFLDFKFTSSEVADTSSMFIRLHIETTLNCNLDCKMCPRANLNYNSGNMEFGDFKKIIDKIPNLVEIQLGGLGEPLITPDILKMVNYLKLKRIHFGLATNGTLLTEEVASTLLECNIDWIAISVDSITSKIYGLIRGSNKLGEVIENIKNLQNFKIKYKKKVFTEITMVYMKENIDELFSIIEFANKLKFNGVRIKMLENWDPENACNMKGGSLENRYYLTENEYLPRIYKAMKKGEKLRYRL